MVRKRAYIFYASFFIGVAALIGINMHDGFASFKDEIELKTDNRTAEVLKSSPITISTLNVVDQATAIESKIIRSHQKIALGAIGLVGTGLTFTLEVFGATGAFWGATDVFGWRDQNNDYQYRLAAMAIGGAALLRYTCVHALNSKKYKDYRGAIDNAEGFDKIIKALEYPIPAVAIAFQEIANKFRSFKDPTATEPEDVDSEVAIILKCANNHGSNECDSLCTSSHLKQRNKQNVFECELKPAAPVNIREQ